MGKVMRICSFLPSATEILYALNLGDSVAGVTYECDFPAEARQKPVVVHTKLPPGLSPADIDRKVREFLSRGESLYRVDVEALQQIEPDLIVTQDLCHVCAASPSDLGAMLALLPRSPKLISLTPNRLNDVWENIRRVGRMTSRNKRAEALVAELERRVAAVDRSVRDTPRPRVVCREWVDPPFVAGHWVPEMVALAGGVDVLGRIGEPGFRVTWDVILESQAEVLVLMPCGYGLAQTLDEFACLQFPRGWENLPAVRHGRVYATDGSGYFSRPGPRLAGGVEVLAHIFHPDRCSVAPPPASAANCAELARQHRAIKPGRE